LAIIITDVQDMDPIFINLPYSTNIYEHSPPVRPSWSWKWGTFFLTISYPTPVMAEMGLLAGKTMGPLYIPSPQPLTHP
jgi:hypothetical protein